MRDTIPVFLSKLAARRMNSNRWEPRWDYCPGSRLLFYTDGLTEVFRGDEEFGPERLMAEFSKCPGEQADVILDSLWSAIDEFAEGGPQGDDMTALALCRCAEGTEMPA